MTAAAWQTLLSRRAGPREKCRGGPAIAIVAEDDLPRTIGLLVDGVVSQAQESRMDDVVDSAAAAGLGAVVQGSWDAFKAGIEVKEALDANPIIADAFAELDALEACAKNPSAPVTKRERTEPRRSAGGAQHRRERTPEDEGGGLRPLHHQRRRHGPRPGRRGPAAASARVVEAALV